MKQSHRIIVSSLVALAAVTAAGCSSGSRESGDVTSSFKKSEACIECHNTNKVSPVTGAVIVEEWKNSAHNLKNGAACTDCHNPDGASTHPVGSITSNPGDNVCDACHTAATMKTGSDHFSNTGASYLGFATRDRAAAGTFTVNACRTCHNPHDTSSLIQVNRDWKASGHGNIGSAAFNDDPFIKYASGGCARCHSGSGFRYFMTNNQTTRTAAVLGSYSSAKEAIGCSACHTDYAWKRITALSTFATFSAPYKRSPKGGTKAFPTNVGDTSLCIPCHAGRSGGGNVLATTNFANTSLPSPHYLPAAGLMYMKQGYTDFVPGSTVIGTSTYAKTLTIDNSTDPVNGISGGVSSTHRKLGTSLINGDSHNASFFVTGNYLSTGGPCVACHMKANHTLKIDAAAYNKVCVKCHQSEGVIALDGNNFQTYFLEPQKEVFQNAIRLAIQLLKDNYGILFRDSSTTNTFSAGLFGGGFYDLILDPTGATGVMDWTRGGTLTTAEAQNLMGAAFNIRLLANDPAAYAHARTYARRLLYDSIDFVDDKVNNLSVGVTALTVSGQSGALVAGKYSKGSSAYSDGTLTVLGTGTSESMLYIIGWDRTTGAWSSPERP
jgi:hypothetical protein